MADSNKKLKIGEKVYAGQQLGTVVSGASELVVVIFQHSLNSPDLRFIIPQFVSEGRTGVLLSSQKYKVIHPDEVRALEMTNREIRKILK